MPVALAGGACGGHGPLLHKAPARRPVPGGPNLLETARKREIVIDFGRDERDTGSSSVQIALLSERISGLTEHLKVHPKDHHSRRGLLSLVSQRRALLDYVKRHREPTYRSLISRLGLRR